MTGNQSLSRQWQFCLGCGRIPFGTLFSGDSPVTKEGERGVQELIQRVRALETSASSSSGLGKDFRVIEMHIARAEEKILRLARGSSWTRGELPVQMTKDIL